MDDRRILDRLQDLVQRGLRPLATRIANTVARGVVQLADDSMKLQLLQLGVLADETVDNAEYHQPYGFSSVPLAGAEAVVVFSNGDRSHPLVIGASDRRYRPTGGEPGQVTMYHYSGSKVTMFANGSIEITAAHGSTVSIGDGGATLPLATKQDLATLLSAITGAVIVPLDGGASLKSTLLAALASASWPVGTTVLKGE